MDEKKGKTMMGPGSDRNLTCGRFEEDNFFVTLSVCITEEDGTAEMTPSLLTLIFRVFNQGTSKLISLPEQWL